jgi:hypothetical protein
MFNFNSYSLSCVRSESFMLPRGLHSRLLQRRSRETAASAQIFDRIRGIMRTSIGLRNRDRGQCRQVKSVIRYGITVCLVAFLATAWARGKALPSVRDGDLIFQTSRSTQSLAIQRATGSPYSHMGIVFLREGKLYVFEAIATVRFTPLDHWIARGAGHHFVLKRLRNANTALDSAGPHQTSHGSPALRGPAVRSHVRMVR